MSDVNPNPTPWHSTIADADLRGFVELKGWDSPDKAVQSYRELEKFRGAPADRLLVLPEKPDDPGWGDIHKRLGFAAPEKPDEYELPVPEGFDDAYAKAVAAEAHKLGIPKHMLKGLSEFNNKYVAETIAAQERAIEEGVKEAQAALRAEWGGNYETSMALGQRAQEAMKADLGIDDTELLALQNAAPRAFYKMLAGYGSTMGEARRVDGDPASGTDLRQLSPEAAATRKRELQNDAGFRERYLAGDAAAVREMSHINRILANTGR